MNKYLKLLFAFKGKIERVCGVWLINLLARQYTWGPSRVVAEQLSLTMSCSPHLCAQYTHLFAQHLHRCPQGHHHLSMFAKLVHHKSGFLCQYSMLPPNETWHFQPQPPPRNILLFSFLPDHRRKEVCTPFLKACLTFDRSAYFGLDFSVPSLLSREERRKN